MSAEARTPRESAETLLARYLELVAFWLPRKERRDILAELEGDLRAQWQEEESERGHALGAEEMEALLERWGHPMRIAGRYLPRRHLIGPELFPLYLFALKGVALVYLGPWLIVWLALVLLSPAYRAAHPGWELLGTLATFWNIAFFSFGSITIAFALLERSWGRSGLPAWNARHAPEHDPDLIPRANSGLALVAHLVFLLWWLTPAALPGDGDAGARAVWLELHERSSVLVLLLALAGAALSCVNWIRPQWTTTRLAARTALDALWTALLVWTLTGYLDVRTQIDRIVAAKASDNEAEALVSAARLAVFAVLAILAAAFAWSLSRDCLRLLRRQKAHLRALGASLLALLVAGRDVRAQEDVPGSGTTLPATAEVESLLRDRVDVQRKSLCAVVGIVSPEGRRIFAHGKLAADDPRAPDGDTLFEIGSVTKVFTALLLADMVQRGEVALANPAARYLPEGVSVPERNGRQITLVDLATQTSGLPFWPANLAPSPDALARYSDLDLYDFLASYELTREVGTQWDYSNLGFGLLGHVLALRAEREFEALVRERITVPLAMGSTAIALSPEQKSRLATGHDAESRPAPPWHAPVLPGAGSLRSSANDLLTFLAACTGLVESPLAPALSSMIATRRPGPGFEQALGWWVLALGPGDEGFATHGGATHGFACTLAYDPKARVGAVFLSNSAADDGGLVWHLLRPAFPVASSTAAKARSERAEVAVAPALLERYAGRYETGDGASLAIEVRDDALWFVSESVPAGLRLRAASEREFFAHEAEFELVFEPVAVGGPASLTVSFAGSKTPARRVADEPR